MSLHFPLPKIRTFRFSLHTSRLSFLKMVTIVALKFAMSSQFPLPKISPSLFRSSQMARAARRVIENSRHPAQSYAVLPIEKLNQIKAGPPLEAILVIFGRRALIFFLFESSWKKMKNDATFVRMRSGDHLGDAKMSKKGTSLRRI